MPPVSWADHNTKAGCIALVFEESIPVNADVNTIPLALRFDWAIPGKTTKFAANQMDTTNSVVCDGYA
jgi:hypothetical protein